MTDSLDPVSRTMQPEEFITSEEQALIWNEAYGENHWATEILPKDTKDKRDLKEDSSH